jgi:hypothetical protein
MQTIIVAMVSGLFSGLLSVWLTLRSQHKAEIKRQKIETIRELAGYRFVLIKTQEANASDKSRFSAAFNQVFVMFADDAGAMSALQDFHTAIVSGLGATVANDKLVSLFKALAKSAGIDFSQLNDAFFLTPFHYS